MIEKHYGCSLLFWIYALNDKKFSAVLTDSNTWNFILYEDINLNTLHLDFNSLFEWLFCIFHS